MSLCTSSWSCAFTLRAAFHFSKRAIYHKVKKPKNGSVNTRNDHQDAPASKAIPKAVATFRFPGRTLVAVVLNALMGLPPVVVGLLVYLMLSASGPLGVLRLLYTPTAMIIAQMVLVTPIVAALTRQVIEDLNREYAEQFASMGVGPIDRLAAMLWDARYSLLTVALAGFGRAVAEVGAVIIVGGNINHVTRVMTTTIALETSKGNLQLALALGLILLLIAFSVNAAVMALRASAVRSAYA